MSNERFAYRRADTVEDALALVDANPDAALLAGGHTLLANSEIGVANPETVVDISGIDAMSGIERHGDHVRIGALTPYTEILENDVLVTHARVLTETVGTIGDTQVRNRATIGGNLVRPEPTADLSAGIIAGDATLIARSQRGERRIAADEFFRPMRMTALDPDELLIGVDIPLMDGVSTGAYVKTQSPSARYSLVGVAARVTLENGRVSAARVAANGAVTHGIRLPSVENTLEQAELTGDTVEAAAKRATAGLDDADLMDDSQASAGYRAQLLEAYTQRALERVAERAGHLAHA